MIGQYALVSLRKVLKQRKVRGGIRDCLEVVSVGKAVGVDERSGSLDEREAVLEPIPLFAGEWSGAERLDVFHTEGMLLERIIHQAKKRRSPWHRFLSNLHAVGEIEEPSLKPAIVAEALMKERAPCRIGEIAIDGGGEVGIERAADIVALDQAAIGHEIGKVCAHPILKGGDAGHRCQLECHEVAEMNRRKSCQKPTQRLWMAKVKGIIECMWSVRWFHRQNWGVMLGFARATHLCLVA